MFKRLVRAATMVALVLLLAVQPVLADGHTPEGARLPGEGALPFLFAGFTVAVLGMVGYLFYLHRKDHHLTREIEELRREVAERETRS